MSKAKLKDIAEAAGVSIGTASRALRGVTKGQWESSARQIQRIQQIAREMNYQPNRAAQFMRTRRTQQVALITAELDTPGMSQTIALVNEELAKRGYSLLIRLLNGGSGESLRDQMAGLGLDFVDGVFNCHPALGHEALEGLMPAVPVVSYDRDATCSPAVLDLETGVMLGLRHLWDQGHRNIALLVARGDAVRNTRCEEAVAQFYQLRKAAYEQAWKITTTWSPESGPMDVSPLLGTDCTACLCGDDLLALGLCAGLRERGYSVPDDYSLVSLDDSLLARISHPRLTCLAAPRRELVALSVQALLAKIGDEPGPEYSTFVPELIVRESTAAPKDE